MQKTLSAMKGKSWPSWVYQTFQKGLLFGILVVDTVGRVQNLEIKKTIIFNLNNCIRILKPSLVQIYQGKYL